jgi:hypothetical protein
MIADLQRNRVRWVVRDSGFDNFVEPNGSSRSSGVFLLDHYLADRFRPVARTGTLSIWLAKGVAAPSLQTGPTACNLLPA